MPSTQLGFLPRAHVDGLSLLFPVPFNRERRPSRLLPSSFPARKREVMCPAHDAGFPPTAQHALEPRNPLLSQSDVYMVSAHAFEHLRQTKEFGLRVIFSLPLAGPGTAATLSPAASPGTNASMAASSADGSGGTAGFDTASGIVGGGGGGGGGVGAGRAMAHAAVNLPSRVTAASVTPRRRRWGLFFRRLVCWRAGDRRLWGDRWWRRPATRYFTRGGLLCSDRKGLGGSFLLPR